MAESGTEARWTTSVSAVLLCWGAGVTDVLSYLTLGKIFTSAMTGCAALFFVKAAGGDFSTAARAALALASYAAGCGAAVLLQPGEAEQVTSPFTLRRLLLLECVMLAGYVALALHGPARPGGGLRLGLIFISAAAMGVQSIVAQDLAEPGISTVVLNPTLTSLSVACMNVARGREVRLPRPNRLQAVVLVAYAAGAVAAAFGVPRSAAAVAVLPVAAAAGVLALTQADCVFARAAKEDGGDPAGRMEGAG